MKRATLIIMSLCISAMVNAQCSVGITSTTNVSCFGMSDGNLCATATNGTPPYSYVWSNGSNSNCIIYIPPGTYTVSITDALGCTSSASALITSPSLTEVYVSSFTNPNCFTGNNGSITLATSGGTPPYNYIWSNGDVGSTITNLSPATYCVTVVDYYACTSTTCVTISSPPMLTAVVTPLAPSCAGDSNGSALASGSGGTPPYSYHWSDGDTTALQNDLWAGVFTVTVTDSSGCTGNGQVTIQTDPNITLTSNTTQIWTGDTAWITAGGGDMYYWSTGDTTSEIAVTPNTTTTYMVTVTSLGSGCTASSSITITVLQTQYTVHKAGRVYNDLNDNAIWDIGEPPLADRIIKQDPFPYYFATDDSGYYQAYYDTGSYNLSIHANSWLCQPNPLVHSLSSLNDSTNDFGIHCELVQDLYIHMYSGPARPGFIMYYTIYYGNQGGDTVSGIVGMKYDHNLSFSVANPAYNQHSGDTLVWNYSNLLPGEQRSISVAFLVSPSALIGDTVFSNAAIYPVNNDTATFNNYCNTIRRITNSYDPNDKSVSKSSMTPDDLQYDNELLYTIRFQNTGTDTAFKVIIRDTLSDDLIIPALLTIGSSHACDFNIEPSGVAVWTFNNILLPDSGTDYDGSQGYLMFTIKARSNLSIGDTIQNTAGIYFDFNPPIITNSANTVIVSVITGIQETEKSDGLFIYPNPTAGTIQISYGAETSSGLEMKIFSLSGQVLVQDHISDFKGLYENTLKLDQFPDGIYFIRILTEKTSALRKIVLIR